MRDQVSLGLLVMELLSWQRKQSCSQIKNQGSGKKNLDFLQLFASSVRQTKVKH